MPRSTIRDPNPERDEKLFAMSEDELKAEIVREAMWWFELIRPFTDSPYWVDVLGDATDDDPYPFRNRMLDLAEALDAKERKRSAQRWTREDLEEIADARDHRQEHAGDEVNEQINTDRRRRHRDAQTVATLQEWLEHAKEHLAMWEKSGEQVAEDGRRDVRARA